MRDYRLYLALGDSISIDLYPDDDYRERHGLVHAPAPRSQGDRAQEGTPEFTSGVPEGLGACSLFFRNQDAIWPEFRGRDLVSLCTGIELEDETRDGATTTSVLDEQLPQVAATREPVLVTLTAGGNDLLGIIGASQAQGDRAVAEMLRRLAQIVADIRTRCPAGIVLLGTVYDPTDGTRKLDEVQLRPQELLWLDRFNDGVRALCHEPVSLADIHHRFLGHGILSPPAERWYWSRSSIEPGARGASEVRRLWLEAI